MQMVDEKNTEEIKNCENSIDEKTLCPPDFTLIPLNKEINEIQKKTKENLTSANGLCSICSKPCSLKCVSCSNSVIPRKFPFYCSKEHQKEDWEQHKKSCVSIRVNKVIKGKKKPSRPVDFLVESIYNDCLPQLDSPCYKSFKFSNCGNEVEEMELLFLYTGLVKFIEVDIDELEEAALKGNLFEYAAREYEGVIRDEREIFKTIDGTYKWLMSKKHIFKD